MAGAGYKLFNTGDVLTAAQVNTYLMEQTVMVFNDAAARTTALSGVVAEGMLSYLKSTKQVEVYNGSAWVASDDPNAIQNTIVDAKGDLISATAADTPARLASSGINGQVLAIDTSTATGLKWQGADQIQEQVFTSSNATWTIPTGVTKFWALVVGSGGGGGASSNATLNNSGGGGGAGQVLQRFFTVAGDTQLNITIPAGGAGGTSGGKGSNGSAATIVGVTSATTYATAAGGGGGGGGAAANVSGNSGASGGGNGTSTASGASTGGGGGGGMGNSGSDSLFGPLGRDTADIGGGAAATTIGVTGFNGGGTSETSGGGGINAFGRSVGGGGAGAATATGIAQNFGAGTPSAINAVGANATANTGAGGGGAKTNATTAYNGGNGGSGLVILRYIGA